MAGYGTDQGFTDWLSANGYTLPDGAPTDAVLRERGSAYIDATYGSRFVGTPTDPSQEREWPRKDATIFGAAIASTDVPQRVVQASYQAAWIEASSPGSLSNTYTPGTQKVLTEVKGIKWTIVGKADGSRDMVPVSTAVEGILAPLLVSAVPGILVV